MRLCQQVQLIVARLWCISPTNWRQTNHHQHGPLTLGSYKDNFEIGDQNGRFTLPFWVNLIGD